MGTAISKPDHMKNRNFVKYELKKKWPGMHKSTHRVYVGRDNASKNSNAMTAWCQDQTGDYYNSGGFDCWYFQNPNTAFAFKMRWAGHLVEQESK